MHTHVHLYTTRARAGTGGPIMSARRARAAAWQPREAAARARGAVDGRCTDGAERAWSCTCIGTTRHDVGKGGRGAVRVLLPAAGCLWDAWSWASGDARDAHVAAIELFCRLDSLIVEIV
eukprot:793140-Prymnesium_polylepis.2